MCCAAIPHRYVQAVLLFEQVQNALKKIEHAFEDARPSMNREKKRRQRFAAVIDGAFALCAMIGFGTVVCWIAHALFRLAGVG